MIGSAIGPTRYRRKTRATADAIPRDNAPRPPRPLPGTPSDHLRRRPTHDLEIDTLLSAADGTEAGVIAPRPGVTNANAGVIAT